MKKITILLAFIGFVAFANAQTANNHPNAQTPTPVLKADKTVNNNFVAPQAETGTKTVQATSVSGTPQQSSMNASKEEAKPACCADKKSCNHDSKSCSKEKSGKESTPACCQKGSSGSCNHAQSGKPE
ncbi:MAG: hypothetical protein U0V74_02090 [Chitinophagales bacterium]